MGDVWVVGGSLAEEAGKHPQAAERLRVSSEEAGDVLRELHAGDLLVAPAGDEVVVGEVTAGPEQQEEPGGAQFDHVLTVDWFTRVQRSLLPAGLGDPGDRIARKVDDAQIRTALEGVRSSERMRGG